MLKTFKSLAVASTIALGSVFGLTAEPARAVQCVQDGHAEICFELDGYDNNGYQVWNVVVDNAYTTERFIITCNGKYMVHWRSRGGATQQEAHTFAVAFCGA